MATRSAPVLDKIKTHILTIEHPTGTPAFTSDNVTIHRQYPNEARVQTFNVCRIASVGRESESFLRTQDKELLTVLIEVRRKEQKPSIVESQAELGEKVFDFFERALIEVPSGDVWKVLKREFVEIDDDEYEAGNNIVSRILLTLQR